MGKKKVNTQVIAHKQYELLILWTINSVILHKTRNSFWYLLPLLHPKTRICKFYTFRQEGLKMETFWWFKSGIAHAFWNSTNFQRFKYLHKIIIWVLYQVFSGITAVVTEHCITKNVSEPCILSQCEPFSHTQTWGLILASRLKKSITCTTLRVLFPYNIRLHCNFCCNCVWMCSCWITYWAHGSLSLLPIPHISISHQFLALVLKCVH